MKLRKLFVAAAFLCASATAFAQTYAVYPAAGDGEIQIPNFFNHWWNFTQEETTVNGVTAIKCTATDKGAAASSGWMTASDTNFDFALIADKDLVFDAKAEGQGNWNLRLTASGGVESDVTLAVPADGEFHKIRLNVAESYPGVAARWAAGQANGQDVFTFSLSATELSADAALYFTNVRYDKAVSKRSMTASVSDVTTNSATLSWNAVFPEGYTATEVTVNGQKVDGSNMKLENLAPKTKYSYTIIASGQFQGETYEAIQIVDFTTMREEGDMPVWYGVTDRDGFTADYSITYNADKTLSVEATFETEKETPEADRNFHIYINGNEWLKMKDDGTGKHTGTTESTFEEGTQITWEWYLPYGGGVYQETNTYVVGSENEKPLAIRGSAKAQNLKCDGAEISYTVKAPADAQYKVYYKAVDGQPVEATANPIVLTGLSERTEYAYEVYAVLQGEEPVESRHVTVTFKTTSADAVDLVYNGLTPAAFKNAFYIGESADMRRTICTNIEWTVVMSETGAVYSVDLSAVEKLVGFVPQIWAGGFFTLTKNEATGRFEHNFGVKEEGAKAEISHYFAYDGGAFDFRTPYVEWGQEQDAPQVGEVAELILSANKTNVKVGEEVMVEAVATDANGFYLSADEVDYTVTDECGGDDHALLQNGSFVANTHKGVYTITATIGNISKSIVVNVIGSPESRNLAAGIEGVTDAENVMGGTVANVTDDNLVSQLEWRCADTDEHFLVLDLAKGDETHPGYFIEGVEMLFEGAYATEFTVTLSKEAPAELNAANAAVSTYAVSDDVVFTPSANNTSHVFTTDPATTHRFVTLRTSKALNSGWGIKLRDLKVYGNEDKPSTGVENVTVDNDAPVEYFNLNGQRVNNPAGGVFIRRQGNNVSKVIVK